MYSKHAALPSSPSQDQQEQQQHRHRPAPDAAHTALPPLEQLSLSTPPLGSSSTPASSLSPLSTPELPRGSAKLSPNDRHHLSTRNAYFFEHDSNNSSSTTVATLPASSLSSSSSSTSSAPQTPSHQPDDRVGLAPTPEEQNSPSSSSAASPKRLQLTDRSLDEQQRDLQPADLLQQQQQQHPHQHPQQHPQQHQQHQQQQRQQQQRPPPPHPLRASISSARGRSGGQSRSQLATDAAASSGGGGGKETQHYSPAGPPSASPSNWSIASNDTAPTSANSMVESRIRFEKMPNGSHRHHLSAPKRQQFLSNQVRRLRELLDGRRDREDPAAAAAAAAAAATASPIQHGGGGGGGASQLQFQPASQSFGPHQLKPEVFEHPLSLLKEKYQDLDAEQMGSPVASQRKRPTVKEDFVRKYGELQQIVGKGAFGTVRLSTKRNIETGEEHVYAIKEFKYAYGETQKQYMRRLTSEFCIASSLEHANIIQTMDLLQLHTDTYSEVMEYCAGGDLHSLIASANTLGEPESNCFFSQLVHGVAFLHSMGVVHRDLKPENMLLTSDGCLKIADFGNSEVFRMPWEKKVRSSASIRGSGPFIAPEEFTNKTFDARKVDMWACGIVYMCMRLGRYTWHEASDGDPIWDGFLYKRERLLELQESNPSEHSLPHLNLVALEQASHISQVWPTHISDVMERLLEPDTSKRWQACKVLDSEWFKLIDNCHPTPRPPDQVLDESDFESAVLSSQRVGSKVIPEDTAAAMGYKILKEVRHTHIESRRDDSILSPAS
ncbi:hypothetical protein BGZ98_003450 [Dissophora globulifera]|nr:hypothetical protein BGZ98_003450 [Dissophora globulifera]